MYNSAYKIWIIINPPECSTRACFLNGIIFYRISIAEVKSCKAFVMGVGIPHESRALIRGRLVDDWHSERDFNFQTQNKLSWDLACPSSSAAPPNRSWWIVIAAPSFAIFYSCVQVGKAKGRASISLPKNSSKDVFGEDLQTFLIGVDVYQPTENIECRTIIQSTSGSSLLKNQAICIVPVDILFLWERILDIQASERKKNNE